MNTLELYGIIGAIVFLIVAALSFALWEQNKTVRNQASAMATLQQTVAAYKDTVNTLQTDSAQSKQREEDLDTRLNAIRVQADRSKNKIVIPEKIVHDKDSGALQAYINAQTKSQLRRFEDLTQSGKK